MKAQSATATRREKVEQKEKAILAAARQAFLEQGYDGARMADIAARAGVAEGTVYLYYKTKSDLMHAFVEDFWAELTTLARQAVAPYDKTFDALEALARFHIEMLVEGLDVLRMTQSERVGREGTIENRGYLRTYSCVFDEIWRRGVDRRELDDQAPLWIVRDMYFGWLEYSARTIVLHSDRQTQPVVDGLLSTIRSNWSKSPRDQESPVEGGLVERLESAVARLETLSSADKGADR